MLPLGGEPVELGLRAAIATSVGQAEGLPLDMLLPGVQPVLALGDPALAALEIQPPGPALHGRDRRDRDDEGEQNDEDDQDGDVDCGLESDGRCVS